MCKTANKPWIMSYRRSDDYSPDEIKEGKAMMNRVRRGNPNLNLEYWMKVGMTPTPLSGTQSP